MNVMRSEREVRQAAEDLRYMLEVTHKLQNPPDQLALALALLRWVLNEDDAAVLAEAIVWARSEVANLRAQRREQRLN